MLTRITIRNFKLFEEVHIPLDNGVVFIGPNNSGKTSTLQALSLWHSSLQKWAAKHASKDRNNIPVQRPGVSVNRLDLIPLPVAEVDLIWRDRKTRKSPRGNIRIDLLVQGFSNGKSWTCGLEYDYSGSEVFFCRPLRTGSGRNPERMEIPQEAIDTRVAFLPSMSGLASEEALIREGRINVLVGQGQTAEVLRNLCYRVHQKQQGSDWDDLVQHIRALFGITLEPPVYLENRGTVIMNYREAGSGVRLDLPSAGRGLQQVLLLLAYMYDNEPGTVLLLDEPDAHLEILRQRHIYQLLIEVAGRRGAQIIAASHSEVLLNEAARRETAVAFIGKPHLLARSRSSEVRKALNEIGFDHYYSAESRGWVLYLEGETDLGILKEFATVLQHPAARHLETAFVQYIGNDRSSASRHFHALREASRDLMGVLLLDRPPNGDMAEEPEPEPGLKKMMWRKREIENYLCNRQAVIAFAAEGLEDDLPGRAEKAQRQEKMAMAIEALEKAIRTLGKPEAFSDDIKASDEFLIPLMQNFLESVTPQISREMPQMLGKKDFHRLVQHIPREEIDPEVTEKLDAIVELAEKARSLSPTGS